MLHCFKPYQCYKTSICLKESQPISSPRQHSGPDLAGAKKLGCKQSFSRGPPTKPQLLPRAALYRLQPAQGPLTEREGPIQISWQRGFRLRSPRATERHIICSQPTVMQKQVISGICLESSASPTILVHPRGTTTNRPPLPYTEVGTYLFPSVHVLIILFFPFYVIAQ